MSSLSFDSVFSPGSTNRSGEASQSAPTIHGKGAHDQRNDHARTVASARTLTEASPWILSLRRRCLDFAVALAALVVLTPFLLLAALLVCLGSRGPVFFRQRRMGRHGREFTLYKFRSMTPPAKGSGSCITVAGDSRITPVGAFLRRYKLDEIPQLWNVLRGDMCLVGPRPKLPHHEALHMDCRPGITGAATLAFRREEEFLAGIPAHELEAFYELFVKPAKARLDLEYMRSATIASDLKVLWQTFSSCLFGEEESLAAPATIIARYAEQRMSAPKPGPTPVLPRPLPRESAANAIGFSPEM
jgi:lipopolysaccharide/colanic/teichoic acid biosynthesis glycosyltransferase